jgi:zinc protease
VPERLTPEWYAMGLIDQLLVQGDDSRLHDALVRQRGFTGSVAGGINLLGSMFDIEGPALWTAYLIHDAERAAEEILKVIDEEIDRLQTTPVTRDQLELALVKQRSALYAEQEAFFGFGRANLLASFALFDDKPALVNEVEAAFRTVTPELVQKTAREYLRRTNRTVLTIVPKAGPAPAAER